MQRGQVLQGQEEAKPLLSTGRARTQLGILFCKVAAPSSVEGEQRISRSLPGRTSDTPRWPGLYSLQDTVMPGTP